MYHYFKNMYVIKLKSGGEETRHETTYVRAIRVRQEAKEQQQQQHQQQQQNNGRILFIILAIITREGLY